MASPALEALRQQQILTGVLNDEPGILLAVTQSLQGRLDREFVPLDMWRTMQATRCDRVGNPVPNRPAQNMVDAMLTRVMHAVPYWVEHEMADVVVHAAESRPGMPVHADDIPCQVGFVWFHGASEIGFVDQDGVLETMVITSMLWVVTVNADDQPGVWVTYFSDPSHPRDALADTLKANPKVDPFSGLRGFAVAWSGFVPFGVDLIHAWWMQVAATFFHLITLPSVTSGVIEPDNKIRKWVAREKKPVVANTVTVITLRRQKPEGPTPPGPDTLSTGRKVNVRFMVGEQTGGFWRQQYYPSTGEHRPIWIMPYVKGPDGAPFVFRRTKIYAWRR